MIDDKKIYDQFEIRKLIESFEMQTFDEIKINTIDEVVINFKKIELKRVENDCFYLKTKEPIYFSDFKVKFSNIKNVVIDEESKVGNLKINMVNGTSILMLYLNY